MDAGLDKIQSSSLNAAVSALSGGRLRVGRFDGVRGLQAVRSIASGDPLMSVPLDMILLPGGHQASLCPQSKEKQVRRRSSSSSELYQLSANLCRILEKDEADHWSLDARHIRECLLGEADADAEAAITAASEVVELRLRLRQALAAVGGPQLGYFGRLIVCELAAPAERWLAQQLPPGVDRRLWLACCYWVNTRVVHCPVVNKPALVPYFDMFNHALSASVRTEFEVASRRFTLTTHTSYAADDQVYINYGNHSNLTLLTEYNFVLGSGAANEHDSLPVDVVGMLPLSPGQLRQFLNELHARGMCPHSCDYLLANPAVLAKYFHLSVDGPSYYLLLLMLVTSEDAGSRDLSSVIQSASEDQMVEQLRDRLATLYMTVKADLLRDRNQILRMMTGDLLGDDDCDEAYNSLIGNCVTLLDIWCDIVNAISDK